VLQTKPQRNSVAAIDTRSANFGYSSKPGSVDEEQSACEQLSSSSSVMPQSIKEINEDNIEEEISKPATAALDNKPVK
jgi:hypothetical protein